MGAAFSLLILDFSVSFMGATCFLLGAGVLLIPARGLMAKVVPLILHAGQV